MREAPCGIASCGPPVPWAPFFLIPHHLLSMFSEMLSPRYRTMRKARNTGWPQIGWFHIASAGCDDDRFFMSSSVAVPAFSIHLGQ